MGAAEAAAACHTAQVLDSAAAVQSHQPQTFAMTLGPRLRQRRWPTLAWKASVTAASPLLQLLGTSRPEMACLVMAWLSGCVPALTTWPMFISGCVPLQLALQLPLQVPKLDSEVVTAQQQRSTEALANVKGTDGPFMVA